MWLLKKLLSTLDSLKPFGPDAHNIPIGKYCYHNDEIAPYSNSSVIFTQSLNSDNLATRRLANRHLMLHQYYKGG